ncbi:MAG TPA: hypothetical protein VIK37_00610 [Candidatus Saccharimonadales bacterium]
MEKLIAQRLGRSQDTVHNGSENDVKPDENGIVRRFGRRPYDPERLPPRRAIWHRIEDESDTEYQIPVTVIGVRDYKDGEPRYTVEDSPILGDWTKNGIPGSELQWLDETSEKLEPTGEEKSHQVQSAEPQIIVENGNLGPEELVVQTNQLEPEKHQLVPDMRHTPAQIMPGLVGRISEATRAGSQRAVVWWRIRSNEYKQAKKIDKRVAIGAVLGTAALITTGYIVYKYKN